MASCQLIRAVTQIIVRKVTAEVMNGMTPSTTMF